MPQSLSFSRDIPLSSLTCPQIQQHCLSQAGRMHARRYPGRLLRYWFMHGLLQAESRRRGPLAICEFGVDRGQMLHYARAAARLDNAGEPQDWLRCWDAVDVLPQTQALQAAGYQRQITLDLESDPLLPDMTARYDVIILLHVLEHLHEPEAALARVLPALKPGGLLIGGMPVLPDVLVPWRERRLRRTARLHGHVSAFSPRRIRAWAQRFGLQEELCSGAFLLRCKKLWLEDHAWWTRLNLCFGALAPWWPGEIYWSFRTAELSPEGSGRRPPGHRASGPAPDPAGDPTAC